MARMRRRFTAEYRVEAAHRVIDSDRQIAEVARELDVGEQLLGRWVRDERVRISAATVVPNVPSLRPTSPSSRARSSSGRPVTAGISSITGVHCSRRARSFITWAARPNQRSNGPPCSAGAGSGT